jgi:hypothetical protein
LHEAALNLADVQRRVDALATSCRMSTFNTRLSPVSVSMATLLTAAP